MSNDQERSEAARAQALIARYYAHPARRLTTAREFFNRSSRHYDTINRLFSLSCGPGTASPVCARPGSNGVPA